MSHIKGFKQMMSRGKWSGTTWPRTLLKKFVYEDTQDLDTGIGNTSAGNAYRLTSLYDPDQATGLGQNSVINFTSFLSENGPYKKYLVMGCKVKIRMTNYGGGMAQCQVLIQRVGTGGESVPTTALNQIQYDELATLPGASEPFMIGPLTGGNNMKYRSFYVTPFKAMGVQRTEYVAQDDYKGSYTASPVTYPSMSINVLGLNAQAQVQMRVKLTYYAILIDPEQIPNFNALDPHPGV